MRRAATSRNPALPKNPHRGEQKDDSQHSGYLVSVRLGILSCCLLCWLVGLASDVAAQQLRRVGHSEVRQACISDGSAKMQHYWDVAAFDWGGVVPLNSWYHPQLLSLDSHSSLLEHRALALPHDGQGNEDDPRARIVSHRGPTAKETFVLFSIFGYEEIDDENGKDRRDSAVMSLRTVREPNSIRMPRRRARVVNMLPEESRRGLGEIPASCGVAYDQTLGVVFAPRQRPQDLGKREMLQAFRFDDTTGAFIGRQSIAMPSTFKPRHLMTTIDASARYGLIAMGFETPWSPADKRAGIGLLQYGPGDGSRFVSIRSSSFQEDLTLAGDSKANAGRMDRPTSAAFWDDGRNVFLLVASGNPSKRYGGEYAGGVHVFSLGPIGGPYRLAKPIAKLAMPVGVEQLRVLNDSLVLSANGLHLVDLKQLVRTRGVTRDRSLFVARYALPYDTHGFDFANVDGQQRIVLACGRNGLDQFVLAAKKSSDEWTLETNERRAGKINERSVQVVLETGKGLRQLGEPSLNARGDVACWAVTDQMNEAIVVASNGKPARTIAIAGETYQSFGTPAINARGEVAFWAGMANGEETILVFRNGTLERIAEPGEFRLLRLPRLADNGSVVFLGIPADQKQKLRTLYRTDERKKREAIFTESPKSMRLGNSLLGDFAADYDIASDGRSVAWIAERAKPRENQLLVWRDGQTKNLGAIGRDMQRLRFGVSNRFLTFRRWKDEVLAQCRLGLQDPSPASAVVEAARRRTRYGRPPANPGEFLGGRSDSKGNVLFTIVENTQTAKGYAALGEQIWHYDVTNKQVQTLVRPLDRFGDKTVLRATVFDSVQDGQAAVQLEWKSNVDRSLGQSIILLKPVAP